MIGTLHTPKIQLRVVHEIACWLVEMLRRTKNLKLVNPTLDETSVISSSLSISIALFISNARPPTRTHICTITSTFPACSVRKLFRRAMSSDDMEKLMDEDIYFTPPQIVLFRSFETVVRVKSQDPVCGWYQSGSGSP